MDTTNSLKEIAKDCFDMALEQIKHLNPSVSLNEKGYDYWASMENGVFFLYVSSPDVGSLSFAEEEAPDAEKVLE